MVERVGVRGRVMTQGETKAQRAERLRIDRIVRAERRSRETPEQHAQRTAKLRERRRRRESEETQEERADRLARRREDQRRLRRGANKRCADSV